MTQIAYCGSLGMHFRVSRDLFNHSTIALIFIKCIDLLHKDKVRHYDYVLP